MGFPMWKSMHPQIRHSHANSLESLLQKGCDAVGETWEECLSECNEICYKDPVLKDQQWSAYIDLSPGASNFSEYEMCREKIDRVRPNRSSPPKPPPVEKPPNPPATKPNEPAEDVPSTSP